MHASTQRVRGAAFPEWGSLELVLALGVATASIALGALAAARPELTAALIGLACAAAAAIAFGRRVRSWFALSVFGLLGGYMALNRGFAGIQLPIGQTPLYIGELALAALIVPSVSQLRGKGLPLPFAALLAWMTYNALLTFANLPEFGLVAIRDAATWYYGLFAVVGAALWYTLGDAGARRWYRGLFLVAYAGGVLGLMTSANVIPPVRIPFSDISGLTDFREDAMSVQMIGALGFFLAVESSARSPLKPWMTWLCVALSVALVGATLGRGPIVALLAAITVLMAFGLWRRVGAVMLAAAMLIIVLVVADVQVATSRGVVSASSIVERQLSIVSYLTNGGASDADPNAAGTINWRVVWWQGLLEQALADPRILVLGRGYGPDLRDVVADLEGFDGTSYRQGDDVGRPLRSPHNIAITVLSRSGLVGLSLWLLMLGAAFKSVIQRVRMSRQVGDRQHELFGVWLLVYLAATVIIACFGVLLEGPFAAIPFFCTLGLAIAWAAERNREVNQAARA